MERMMKKVAHLSANVMFVMFACSLQWMMMMMTGCFVAVGWSGPWAVTS